MSIVSTKELITIKVDGTNGVRHVSIGLDDDSVVKRTTAMQNNRQVGYRPDERLPRAVLDVIREYSERIYLLYPEHVRNNPEVAVGDYLNVQFFFTSGGNTEGKRYEDLDICVNVLVEQVEDDVVWLCGRRLIVAKDKITYRGASEAYIHNFGLLNFTLFSDSHGHMIVSSDTSLPTKIPSRHRDLFFEAPKEDGINNVAYQLLKELFSIGLYDKSREETKALVF